STLIRVSSRPVRAYPDRSEVLFALSRGAGEHLGDRIGGTLLVTDDGYGIEGAVALPITSRADELGGPRLANVIAAGAAASPHQVKQAVFDDAVRSLFERKGPEILRKDLEAGRIGYEIGEKLRNHLHVMVGPDPAVRDHLLLNGPEATGMGCIAGGCRF